MRFLILIFFVGSMASAQVSVVEKAQDLGISVTCGYTFLGNGISFYDYDKDGWDDITIASADGDPIHFFKNFNGNFISHNINIPNNVLENKQINWVDIDNDGDNDLFVTSASSGNRLYENTGNMIMQDITSSSGMLPDNFPYYGASWGDYNNDGFLDVFICVRDNSIPNILYKNNGDKTFTLVNNQAGLLTTGYMTLCAAFLDYDNDGDQDIYVSNDKTVVPNLMYRNNGDGTFTEVGAITGTNISIDAMSVTVEDLNNDGWLDMYITNEPQGNVLFVNNGDGTFTDMAQSYNVTYNSTSWSAIFIDADNDKDLDLYVSGENNGIISNQLSSAFYINNDNGTFTLNNSAVPGDFASSHGNALGDIDNDGFPDIVVNNISHNNIFLWKNNTNFVNNWLGVSLEGTVSNKQGIGSFIEISINGEIQNRYTLLGEGYLSQNSGTEFFGLGPATTVDYVKVKWLSGLEDVFFNVNANQHLNITEGASLSVDEFDPNHLKIGPNPVNNMLSLRAQNTIDNVTVYNMLGQAVLKAQPNNVNGEIDMTRLQSGAYFVAVTISSITKTVKVIKQ